jgi:hypothetical protein
MSPRPVGSRCPAGPRSTGPSARAARRGTRTRWASGSVARERPGERARPDDPRDHGGPGAVRALVHAGRVLAAVAGGAGGTLRPADGRGPVRALPPAHRPTDGPHHAGPRGLVRRRPAGGQVPHHGADRRLPRVLPGLPGDPGARREGHRDVAGGGPSPGPRAHALRHRDARRRANAGAAHRGPHRGVRHAVHRDRDRDPHEQLPSGSRIHLRRGAAGRGGVLAHGRRVRQSRPRGPDRAPPGDGDGPRRAPRGRQLALRSSRPGVREASGPLREGRGSRGTRRWTR